MKKARLKKSVDERFWAKVDKTDTCWNWTAYKLFNGYGRFSIRGATDYAHRISWELATGKYPKGKHVLHVCDNPGCVRPDHLFLGTMEENMVDRNEKKRQYNSEKLHCRHGYPFSYAKKHRIAKDCKTCEISRRYKSTSDPAIVKERNKRSYAKRTNKGKA